MTKKTNAERCRAYRARKRAEREAAAKLQSPRATAPRTKKKAAPTDVEARREAARQRYASVKEAGGKAYREMLAAAKVRAAAYHARVRAAARGK